MTDRHIAQVAERAAMHLPLVAGGDRSADPRYTLTCEAVSSPATDCVTAIDVPDVDEAVSDARAWFKSHGRDAFTWWVGSTAEPTGLVDALLERGMRRYEPEPFLRAMILDAKPPEVAGVEVRRVDNVEDFRKAVELQCDSFGVPPEERREALAHAPARWEEIDVELSPRYLAYREGRAVGMAGMERLETGQAFLLSGCVVEEARGRGVYRALLHRRFADAEERGWLPLVVQAGQMSAPILERCAFETVGRIELVEDHVG
jgi:GNAT superfamily N-acetyltransferase